MTFFLYLAFVALCYLRPADAFPELEVYRPMLIVGLVALAAAVVHALGAGKTAARKLHFVLLLVLLACIALSHITNGWVGGVAVALSDFSFSTLMFLLTALNVTSIPRLRVTLATIVLSTLIISVMGIAAYHYGFMADQLILFYTSEQSEWRVRYLGILGDPNDFATVIVVALPMLGIWYRQQRFFRNALLLGVPGAVFLYTIFLTHSRGAILGLASLLFFSLRKTLGMVKTGLLLGVLLGAVVVTNVAGERGFSMEEESAGDRILAWSEGLEMLRYRPLFGVGYHNFTEHHNLTAHNLFVLCFAELGLIGYFTWLALVVTAFRAVSSVVQAVPVTSAVVAVQEEQEPEVVAVEASTPAPGPVGLTPHQGKGGLDAVCGEGAEVVRLYAAMLRSSLLGFLTCAYFLSRTYTAPLYLLLALCVVTWHCAGGDESHPKVLPTQRWGLLTAALLVGSIALAYVMVLFKHATG